MRFIKHIGHKRVPDQITFDDILHWRIRYMLVVHVFMFFFLVIFLMLQIQITISYKCREKKIICSNVHFFIFLFYEIRTKLAFW